MLQNAPDMRLQYGFTLLETLVALAIIAIALGASFRALGMATQTTDELRYRLLADWVAENRLAALRASPGLPQLGTRQAEATQAGETFRFEERVSALTGGRRQVDIQVAIVSKPGHTLTRLQGVFGP